MSATITMPPVWRRDDDEDEESHAAATPTATVTLSNSGDDVDDDNEVCTPFALPSGGVLTLGPSSTITLTADALFTPECTDYTSTVREITDVIDMQDPFHSSIVPQVYATGAATIISWMLVIMLLITPRTFFVGGPGGRSGLMGRRGMISGASGGTSVIGVGSRPWLQKVAALTVAISMTIATADTFKVAEEQYNDGYFDADAIREKVVGGLEIKISRVVSDVFLLLAQVQTLIRLFPRHKEKVIIKWVGFALIILDMTFSSVNSFMGHDIGIPAHFNDAIPALAYLFELALSMLYAAWVLYYSLTKRRYAYYHKMMYNISLVALLSTIAILTPVVFFATDISNYSVAGWGDYFRWVGAAAASVIVWEWVERIEALEREDKKDGILGREIFDGDEMLDITPSTEITWPGTRRNRRSKDDRGDGGGGGGIYASGTSTSGFGVSQRLGRVRQSQFEDRNFIPLGRLHSYQASNQGTTGAASPTPPAPIATPLSRTDTTSGESTVYAVRYHSIVDPITPVTRQPPNHEHIRFDLGTNRDRLDHSEEKESHTTDKPGDLENQAKKSSNARVASVSNSVWNALISPFKRRRTTPPPQILGARVIEPSLESSPAAPRELRQPAQNYAWWDMKGRLGAVAGEIGEGLLERIGNRQQDVKLPITVIPAQPRGGRTWSPDALTALSASSRSNFHDSHTSLQEPERDHEQGSQSTEAEWAVRNRSVASSTPHARSTTPAVSSPLTQEPGVT